MQQVKDIRKESMPISEFIARLQRIRKEQGEIGVSVFDPDALREGEIKTIRPYFVFNEDATDLSIVDFETCEAFVD